MTAWPVVFSGCVFHARTPTPFSFEERDPVMHVITIRTTEQMLSKLVEDSSRSLYRDWVGTFKQNRDYHYRDRQNEPNPPALVPKLNKMSGRTDR